MPENYPPTHRHGPRSLFWPVVLIALGLVFLLQNLGLLTMDAGDLLLRLWPLLLVLMGLDGLLNRSGIVGPAFLIGLGAIFLAASFGYLALDAWQVIFAVWPILLIAWGFDVMVGRRSWIASLFGVLVVLGILLGAVAVLTGRIDVRIGRGGQQEVSHTLAGASRLSLAYDIPVGILKLSPGETGLLSGSYYSGNGFDVIEDFSVDGGRAAYTLGTRGDVVAFPMAGGNFAWDYRLPPELPLALAVNQGAGAATLDLTGLIVEGVNAEFGAGSLRVILPDAALEDGAAPAYKLSGGVGFIYIQLPPDVGVRIHRGTALAFFQKPAGYVKDGDYYLSPNYDDAVTKIDLEVNLAVGGVNIR